MFHRFLLVLVVNIFLLCYSGASYALPITFDEALHGDVDEHGEQTFNLDLGRNTISGVSTIGSFVDNDSFKFLLPENAVGRLSFTIDLVRGSDKFDFSSTWEISKLLPLVGNCIYTCIETFKPIAGEVVKTGGSPAIMPASSTKFSELGLLSTGLYSIEQTGGFYMFPHDGVLTYEPTISYRFSIDVQSVPEPGSLVLLSIGLFGFVYSKVSRKRVGLKWAKRFFNA